MHILPGAYLGRFSCLETSLGLNFQWTIYKKKTSGKFQNLLYLCSGIAVNASS